MNVCLLALESDLRDEVVNLLVTSKQPRWNIYKETQLIQEDHRVCIVVSSCPDMIRDSLTQFAFLHDYFSVIVVGDAEWTTANYIEDLLMRPDVAMYSKYVGFFHLPRQSQQKIALQHSFLEFMEKRHVCTCRPQSRAVARGLPPSMYELDAGPHELKEFFIGLALLFGAMFLYLTVCV
jgi:hypothetical protein